MQEKNRTIYRSKTNTQYVDCSFMIFSYSFKTKHIPRKGENNLLVLCCIVWCYVLWMRPMVEVHSLLISIAIVLLSELQKEFSIQYLYVSSNNGLAQAALGKCQWLFFDDLHCERKKEFSIRTKYIRTRYVQYLVRLAQAALGRSQWLFFDDLD